ncbi:uncharacterized protein LOC117008360 isoform X4 [Catharus ustulatus]|uniref:uncharacterized protein LOC117008360 isoform X4 n=1 Tax=Catharus ustulatus TaxID=91951 RepID=UPI00140823D4|nr:uncharacterized protein LOC117008360 isoform X4 [Catharus ustulatus]
MCSRCAPAAEVTLGLSLSPLGHLWVTSGSPLGHLWVRSTPGAPGLVWFVWKTPWRVWGGWKRILQVPEPRSEGKTENSCSSNWISRKTENSCSSLGFPEEQRIPVPPVGFLEEQRIPVPLDWIPNCSSLGFPGKPENSFLPGLDFPEKQGIFLLLSWISRKNREFLFLSWISRTQNSFSSGLDFQENQKFPAPLLHFQAVSQLPVLGSSVGLDPAVSPRCPLVVPSPFRTFFPGVRVGIFGIFPFLLLPCLCLSPEWSCWKCPQAVTGLCPPRGASQESLGIPNSSGILWDLRGRSGAGLILGG